MKELLELILQNITTNPDDVVIEESQEDGRIVYTITVNPEDMGRVIGKDGKVIRAIRSLAHVVSIRKGERYRIKLAETDEPAPQTEEEAKEAPEVSEAPTSEPEATPEPETDAKAEPEAEVTDGDDLIAGAIDIPEEADAAKDEAEAEPKEEPAAKPAK